MSIDGIGLTNFTLGDFMPEVDASNSKVTQVGPSTYMLQLAAKAGLSFSGTGNVGWLKFYVPANQKSAFIALQPQEVAAHLSNGLLVNHKSAGPGRVVVVGADALLEAAVGASGQRSLALYAPPTATYTIQYASSLNGPWTSLPERLSPVTLTTSMPVSQSVPSIVFYRAVRVSSAQSAPTLAAKSN